MTNHTNDGASEKATGGEPDGSKKSANNTRKFSARSTATEAQYHRIVTMLKAGPKSTFDFRKVGIMAPASRIKELNDRYGFYIPTIDLRDLYDEEGFLHKRVGVYELIDEPKKAEVAQ